MENRIYLPPNLKSALTRLASPFLDSQLPSLSVAVQEYGESIAKASISSPFMDVPLARVVCLKTLNILKSYPDLDPDSKKWGAAAVKYFLMRADEINGFTTPGGFEDDALVMHVVTDVILADKAFEKDFSWDSACW
ncbi:MAG: hypothetical protein ABIW76_00285 [Fibrobacteria bacterium]